MRPFLIILLFLALPALTFGQQSNAAQIKQKLRKLNVLGSVLYVAAHPDDENTRVISFMANDKLMETAYLSMTRGDGGQNLIGPEIRDLLGLIRTQELLAARRIDGGKQFFTRAVDFGFSKSSDEAFEIWNKDKILSDVVKVYRLYQPDVIITRFPPDERAGHGHHTGSAILAQDAFDVSGKTNFLPEQVKEFGTWQPKRLYTNTGRWWNTTINENTPGIISLNVGTYNPLLGKSITEIAALSSSQHKSQGWGRPGQRGDDLEFLEFVRGEKASKDLFEGINTSWSRVKGGAKIQPLVTKVIQSFSEDDPAALIPTLLELRKAIQSLDDGVWKKRKLAEVEQLIQDCAGVYLEVKGEEYWISPGEKVDVSIEVINRSSTSITLEKITAKDLSYDSAFILPLKNNIGNNLKTSRTLVASASYSDPYWLKKPHEQGIFSVEDQTMIGKPENPPAAVFTFKFSIGNDVLEIERPLVYKWVDPVKGELQRPVEIVPPISVGLAESVLIFSDGSPQNVNVRIKNTSGNKANGSLILQIPEGWKSEPVSFPFDLNKRGDEVVATFKLFPSASEMTASISAVAKLGNTSFGKALKTIEYDHFPIQTFLPDAKAKVVRINLKKQGNLIGYVSGAGDEIPTALRTMGYEVWELKSDEITKDNLSKVDAVVLGVRALNVNERLKYYMPTLMDYVKSGGALVVQYNTNGRLQTDNFAPYPLTISRDRVTDENSQVSMVKPQHQLLTTPNKISPADFNDWVQERGLYFPNKWDEKYETLLSMRDGEESPKEGSLLVAKYGEGYYIYTGLSFFRQLPEGVPGAYKLFANLVSSGKRTSDSTAKSNQSK